MSRLFFLLCLGTVAIISVDSRHALAHPAQPISQSKPLKVHYKVEQQEAHQVEDEVIDIRNHLVPRKTDLPQNINVILSSLHQDLMSLERDDGVVWDKLSSWRKKMVAVWSHPDKAKYKIAVGGAIATLAVIGLFTPAAPAIATVAGIAGIAYGVVGWLMSVADVENEAYFTNVLKATFFLGIGVLTCGAATAGMGETIGAVADFIGSASESCVQELTGLGVGEIANFAGMRDDIKDQAKWADDACEFDIQFASYGGNDCRKCFKWKVYKYTDGNGAIGPGVVNPTELDNCKPSNINPGSPEDAACKDGWTVGFYDGENVIQTINSDDEFQTVSTYIHDHLVKKLCPNSLEVKKKKED